jgi:membrane protease YdiL (CAAX protease family)
MDSPAPRPSRVVVAAVVLESALALVAVGVGWLVGFSPLEKLPLTLAALPDLAIASAWGVAAALPLLAGLLALERIRWTPLVRIRAVVDEFLDRTLRGASYIDLALLSLMAGIGEEVLFRGLIQAGLAQWIGPPYGLVVGLAVASLAFGVALAITPTYALLAALVGVYLGGLMLATDSLAAPIVAHAVYDFAALVYLSQNRRRSGLGESLE